MSNAAFPDLPGIDIKVRKTPNWKTNVQTAVSGKELRASLMSTPLWKFSLSYNVLRTGAEAELQNVVGFFNARKGKFDNFLYSDPTDSSVTDQGFGVGDGVTTKFQLVRGFGGHSEPVMNLNGNPAVKVNSVPLVINTDFTVDSYGMVTFAVAPANGLALTWTGSYYFRVRFMQDMTDFEQFLWMLWQARKIEFWGSLGVKI